MKNDSFLITVLGVIVWLVKKIYGIEIPLPPTEKPRIIFTKVRLNELTITGDLKEMKVEFGQRIRITATPTDGSGIQPGSAQWSAQATDADGNDRSSDWEVVPNPDNELECDFQHSGTVESVGVATLRADGDRDVDETAEVVGTLALVVDEPNTTAFEMSGSVVEATPAEPAPEV